MKANGALSSNQDIARYVLGLQRSIRVEAIQNRLAHDDAAAACALKWEAYLLSIADALPPSPPPASLLTEIQCSLNMRPLTDDAAIQPIRITTPSAPDATPAHGGPQPGAIGTATAAVEAPSRARRSHHLLGRKRVRALAGAGVVLAALAVAILVTTRPVHHSEVRQVVPLSAQAPGT